MLRLMNKDYVDENSMKFVPSWLKYNSRDRLSLQDVLRVLMHKVLVLEY